MTAIPHPAIAPLFKKTSLLALLAVAFAGCRTTCRCERAAVSDSVVSRAIRCYHANSGKRIALFVSPVQLSTNCGHERDFALELDGYLHSYMRCASRYSVSEEQVAGSIGIGTWLSVKSMPHFNELGCGVAFDCHVVCGLRDDLTGSEVLVNTPFTVERDCLEGESLNERPSEDVTREIALLIAKEIELALERRIPLCGRVVFVRSADAFVMDKGLGDGLRKGDEFAIVAKNRGGCYSIVAFASARPESGRSVLEVSHWEQSSCLCGIPIPGRVPQGMEIYAISV